MCTIYITETFMSPTQSQELYKNTGGISHYAKMLN